MGKVNAAHLGLGALIVGGIAAAGIGIMTLAASQSPSQHESTNDPEQDNGRSTSGTDASTNGNQLIQSSSISGSDEKQYYPLGYEIGGNPLNHTYQNTHSKRNFYDYTTEAWGCTKRLFPTPVYSNIKHERTKDSYFSNLHLLNWYNDAWRPVLNGKWTGGVYKGDTLSKPDKENTIGCAVARIRPLGPEIKGVRHNRDFYFQSEIVVKNSKMGLILWTNWATKNKQNLSTITYRMMLVVNEGYGTAQNHWKLVGGLWWNDNNAGHRSSRDRDYLIKMPGETKPWYTSRYWDYTVSEDKVWSGIWTTNTESESGSAQPIYKDIVVSSGGSEGSELLGSTHEPFETCGSRRWCGWYYGGYFYETRSGRERGWRGFMEFSNIQTELKSWYKGFKDVKGVWTNAETVCKPFENQDKSFRAGTPLRALCEKGAEESFRLMSR